MKDFKKMPKMACGGGVKKYAAGGMSTMDEAYMPEKKFSEMYVPQKKQLGGMPTIEVPTKKPASFDLHKTVKKAANEEVQPKKRGGRIAKKLGTVKKNK